MMEILQVVGAVVGALVAVLVVVAPLTKSTLDDHAEAVLAEVKKVLDGIATSPNTPAK